MRRMRTALLISLISAMAPLVPPVAAQGASDPLPPAISATIAPTPVSRAVLLQRAKERLTHRRLVAAAQSRGVTLGRLRAQWQQVAICEVGGNWAMTGPTYSGIGFLNTVWAAYGGTQYAAMAGRATRDQQILIGMRVTGGWVPDQNGCASGGW